MLTNAGNLVQTFIMLPGCVLLLFIIGYVLLKRYPRIGRKFLLLSFFVLWIFSMPIVAKNFIASLENKYPRIEANSLETSYKNAAIVVLSAGNNMATQEYSNLTTSEGTLTRIHYAAYLHKKLGLQVLASGADGDHPDVNVALIMANTLRNDFGVQTTWLESKGFTTAEEAANIAEILKKEGIKTIYLVTHAYHMKRSVYAFQRQGITVIPAPTGYVPSQAPAGHLSSYLPSIDSLDMSYTAMHEYVGMIWYQLRSTFKNESV